MMNDETDRLIDAMELAVATLSAARDDLALRDAREAHAALAAHARTLRDALADAAHEKDGLQGCYDSERAAWLAEFNARADAERALAERTATLDALLGTPCEQVRHAQEVRELRADVDRLRDDLVLMREAAFNVLFEPMERRPSVIEARQALARVYTVTDPARARDAPAREVKNAAVDRCVELVQAWDARGAPRFELSELVTAMRAVGAGEGEGR